MAIKSIAIVPGTEGAILAGVTGAPTSISVVGAAGTGAGGAGGASGLSGGAIAGIVIGSVAGGIIALGLVSLLIVATVVAAILIARNRPEKEEEKKEELTMRELSENSAPSGPMDDFSHIGPGRVDDAELERNVSRTLINIFNPPSGGIDVMNNPSSPSSGHLSITARSGPVQNL